MQKTIKYFGKPRNRRSIMKTVLLRPFSSAHGCEFSERWARGLVKWTACGVRENIEMSQNQRDFHWQKDYKNHAY